MNVQPSYSDDYHDADYGDGYSEEGEFNEVNTQHPIANSTNATVNNSNDDKLTGFALKVLSSSTTASEIHQPRKFPSKSSPTQHDILSDIYETFAVKYPNPNLIKFKNEIKVTMMMNGNATKGKEEQIRNGNHDQNGSGRGGLFSKLFSPKSKQEQQGQRHDLNQNDLNKENNHMNVDNKFNHENKEEEEDDIDDFQDLIMNDKDNHKMLGTDSYFQNIIPKEAYMNARLYLSAMKSNGGRSRDDGMSFFKPFDDYQYRSSNSDNMVNEKRALLAIVGIGQIVEYNLSSSSSPSQPNENNDEIRMMETSDRQQLIQQFNGNNSSAIKPNLNVAKCCQISTNCIAICWGFDDGITVIYRKIQNPNRTFQWNSMAIITPSDNILHAASENVTPTVQQRRDEDEDGDRYPKSGVSSWWRSDGDLQEENYRQALLFESGLLRVSDIIPIYQMNQLQEQNVTVTSLVIARMGGFIECISLPNELCRGPVLAPRTPKKHTSASSSSSSSSSIMHYAQGLPNLSLDNELPPTAISTKEYHDDITATTAYKVCNDDPRDNTQLFDYVMCTVGTSTCEQMLYSSNHGNVDDDDDDALQVQKTRECLTLWGLKFSSQTANTSHHVVQVEYIKSIQLDNSGPQTSVFVSTETKSQWLLPTKSNARNVTKMEAYFHKMSQQTKCSITTTTPITSLHMTSFINEQDDKRIVMILAIAFNGSVQIVDCSSVMNLHSDQGDISTELKIVCEHQSTIVDPISDACWWHSASGLLYSFVTTSGQLQLRKVVNHRILDSSNLIFSEKFPGQVSFISSKSTIDALPLTLGKYQNIGEIVIPQICGITTLNATDFLLSLLSQGEFDEFLSLSQKFEDCASNPSLFENNYRLIWEKSFNTNALLLVKDNNYVIETAINLQNLVKKNSTRFDLIHIQNVYKEALSRSDDKKLISELNEMHRKLITYMKLGQQSQDYTLSSNRFFRNFLQINVSDLASCYAIRGDIKALTLLIARHWNKIQMEGQLFKILSCISLNTPVKLYEHLLPFSNHANLGKFQPFFDYFTDNHTNVIDVNEENSLVKGIWIEDGAKVGQWYLARSIAISSKIDDLDEVVEICTIALDRCEISTADAYLQEIALLRSSSFHLNRFLKSSIMANDDSSFLSIEEFQSMGLQNAVGLILDGSQNGEDAILNLNGLIYPMFDNKNYGNFGMNSWWADFKEDGSDENKDLQVAIVLYCITNLNRSYEQDLAIGDNTFQSVERAVSLCETFVKYSDTSLPQQQRIIDDPLFVMQFVLDIASAIDIALTEPIIELLWSMYECLPVRLGNEQESYETGLQILGQSIDFLYKALLTFQLASRWCGNLSSIDVSIKDFIGVYDMMQNDIDEAKQTLIYFGTTLIKTMFRGVCQKVAKLGGSKTLLLKFIADIEDVNEYGCYSFLLTHELIEQHFIQCLLEDGSILILRDLLAIVPELAEKESVYKMIVASMQRSMSTFGSSKDPSKAIFSFEHQEALSLIYPDLEADIGHLRQYADFSIFLHEVLKFDIDDIPSETTLRSKSPMQVIVWLMKDYPDMVVIECPDWINPHYAAKSNSDINQYIKLSQRSNVSSSDPVIQRLPPLVGASILHLAGILGLKDPRNQFLVKNEIAKSLVHVKRYGAAAAVCLMLLHNALIGERAEMGVDREAGVILLHNVASLVSSNNYADKETRKHLCLLCLQWCKETFVHGQNMPMLGVLLRTYIELEKDAFGDISSTDNSCKKTKFLHHLLAHVSNVDESNSIPQLCNDVINQEDSIVLFVAQHVLQWCVNQAISNSNTVNFESRKKVMNILYLSVASIIEDTSKENYSSLYNVISGMRKVLESDLDLQGNWEDGQVSMVPDDYIVQQLIQRGYSPHGSRRAALMTKNINYSAAMVWAVAHFNDTNFDTPVVYLKSEPRVNKSENIGMAFEMKNILESLCSFLQSQNYDKQNIGLVKEIKKEYKMHNARRVLSLSPKAVKEKQSITLADRGRSLLDKARIARLKAENNYKHPLIKTKERLSSNQQTHNHITDECVELNSKITDITPTERGRRLLKKARNAVLKAENLVVHKNEQKALTNLNSQSHKNKSIEEIEKQNWDWDFDDEFDSDSIDIAQTTKEGKEKNAEESRCKQAEAIDLDREKAEEKEGSKKQAEKAHRRRQIEVEVEVEEEERRRIAEAEELARQQADQEERRRIAAEDLARTQAAEEEEQRRIRAEDLARKQAEEEEERRRRIAAEELAKQQAEEEEQLRIAAEAQELARQQAEEQEQLRIAETQELVRQQAEQEEQRRLAEAQELARQEAEEEERRRIRAEELARQQAEEEEQLRIAAEAQELAKIRAEEEEQQLRIAEAQELTRQQAEQEEQLRIAAEDLARTQAAEEEQLRIVAEDLARQQAEEEEERRRIAAEELAKQQAEEEEQLRIAAEAQELAKIRAEEEEQLRIAEAQELARRQAEQEERRRIAADELVRTQAEQEEGERRRIAEAQEFSSQRAEKEEQRRIVEELVTRQAEKEEQLRIVEANKVAKRQAEEEEQRRIAAGELTRRQDEEEEERRRFAVEELTRRQAAEEEQRRITADELASKQAVEEEKRRITAGELARRQAVEEEERRMAEDLARKQEEQRRLVEILAKRQAEEEEQRRISENLATSQAAEEEQLRIVAEELARRQAEEEEQRHLAEEHARRQAEQEEEQRRIAAEPTRKQDDMFPMKQTEGSGWGLNDLDDDNGWGFDDGFVVPEENVSMKPNVAHTLHTGFNSKDHDTASSVGTKVTTANDVSKDSKLTFEQIKAVGDDLNGSLDEDGWDFDF